MFEAILQLSWISLGVSFQAGLLNGGPVCSDSELHIQEDHFILIRSTDSFGVWTHFGLDWFFVHCSQSCGNGIYVSLEKHSFVGDF